MTTTLERDFSCILVDAPAEHVRRITLNRPEKRNAITTTIPTCA
jgi:enoyl-CoA hydratase